MRWRRAARAEPRRRSRATASGQRRRSRAAPAAQASGVAKRRAARTEPQRQETEAHSSGRAGEQQREGRRAAAASRRPPAYGGVGVVPSKPSSVMPPRPRRRRPNRLRVRVPLLSPPVKRLWTCGRRERERDGQRTYIWVSARCDAKCIIHLPTPLDVVFFSWTMQNGFGCRNGYPVGDSLRVAGFGCGERA